jgi:hypothetical protein
MRKWIRKETPPTIDQAIKCGGWFRTADALGNENRPGLRYFDDSDQTWWAVTGNGDDLPSLTPNNSFTHWLDETFPPLPG